VLVRQKTVEHAIGLPRPEYNEDIGKGLLHKIEKDLEKCLGGDWLDD
jgi:hypothetical protein